MDKAHLEMTQALISRDFALEEIPKGISEDELLRHLANQIAYMIEYELERLFSLMYTLDIDESKVSMALSPLSSEAPNIALAKIVLERQKKRAYTKIHIKPEDLGEEWGW